MWSKIVKKISIVIILVLMISLTGCGSKLKSVSKDKVEDESTITNKQDKEILIGGDIVEYKFESDTRIIQVKVKYNKKTFTYDSELLTKENYTLKFYLRDDKYPLYDSLKESIKENVDYLELAINGYEAVRSTSGENATVLIKIDDSTVLSIIGKASEYSHAIDIFNDSDYKDIIKNIKITIKEK